MAGSTPPPMIPLPRGWSRRVRSAVIQAISLAHCSLTSTRSWAVNGRNARVRLNAENSRLRQEVALLREEMRIKDRLDPSGSRAGYTAVGSPVDLPRRRSRSASTNTQQKTPTM
jgi:hypothetical protein